MGGGGGKGYARFPEVHARFPEVQGVERSAERMTQLQSGGGFPPPLGEVDRLVARVIQFLGIIIKDLRACANLTPATQLAWLSLLLYFSFILPGRMVAVAPIARDPADGGGGSLWGGRRTPWRRFVGKSFGMMGPKQTGPFFFTALWGPFSPERGKKKIIYIPGGRPEQFTPPASVRRKHGADLQPARRPRGLAACSSIPPQIILPT